MREHPSDIAFTPAVKAIQSRKGSRADYARMEQGRGWRTVVTSALAEFLARLDMFYLGTSNAESQPYIQYRGGPPGFLKVLDNRTLGFADFGGNRQYITLGNLTENPRAFLFLMDYANSRRVKVWDGESLTMTPNCWSDSQTRPIPAASSGPYCSRSTPGTSTAPSTSTSGALSGRSPQSSSSFRRELRSWSPKSNT